MLFTNVWYVAATSDELSGRPLPRQMLGRDFVLYRDASGQPVCLSDVCPHRGGRLSRGDCDGNGRIGCPFHGWRFDAEGRCRRIPSQADPDGDIPPAARVDSYPAVERYGLVWVFLGDEPEAAAPLIDMPEYSDPRWRRVSFVDTWAANLHWSKMTDLDHVHLPIVHGIDFGGDNPVRPPDHRVESGPFGFRTRIESRPTVTSGDWRRMRGQRTPVSSQLEFMLSGFCLRGQVEIGGAGSGYFNVFYEMSTPIDEEHTRMYWHFFRSFMLEPENDAEHLRRNLRNIFQDKANAESFLPRRAPEQPDWPALKIDREDRLMTAYWNLLQELRGRGWQIDRQALASCDAAGDYRVIPSPARTAGGSRWVFAPVPRIAASASRGRAGLAAAGDGAV